MMTSVTPTSGSGSPAAIDVSSEQAPVPSTSSIVPDADENADGGISMGYEPLERRTRDSDTESDCQGRSVSSRNCLKWADSLHSLLNDTDGLNLFQQFLQQEDPDRFQMLEFWLACRGLSKQPPAQAHQLVRVIYAQLFLKAQLGIDESLRRSITQQIKNDTNEKKLLSPSIFNEACAVVERAMHEVMHPNFLSSDIYLDYVQKMQIADLSNISMTRSCPMTVFQSSQREAPAIPEEPDSIDPQLINQQPLPVLHEDRELTMYGGVSSMRRRSARSTSSAVSQSMDALSTKFLRQFGSVNRSNPSRRLYNYSYNPVSRQDSELQSLSSDARTDSMSDLTFDDMACTKETYAYKKQLQRQFRSMRENANINKNSDLAFSLVPRTSNLHARESAKPLPPEEFAKNLIFKLEKLKKERDAEEIVVHKLKTVEHLHESSATCAAGISSHQDLSEAIAVQRNDDDSQEILDNHLARVWSDKTPLRSPSQGATPIRPKSPDSRKAWSAASNVAPQPARLPHSYVTMGSCVAAKKKDKDLCSLFSSDSGNGTDPTEGVERRHRGNGGSGGSANLVKSKSMPEQNEFHASEHSSSAFSGAAYYPPRGVGKAWSGSRRTLTDSGVSVVSGSRPDNVTPQSPQCKEKLVSSWLSDSNRICGNRAMAGPGPGSGAATSMSAAAMSTASSGGAQCCAMVEEEDSDTHRPRWNTIPYAALVHSLARPKSGRGSSVGLMERSGSGNGGSVSSGSGRNVLPSQPFVADPSMPPLPFHSVDTDTQLEETRRRLKEMGSKLNRPPTTGAVAGSSSKSCESSYGAGSSSSATQIQTISKTEASATHRSSTLTRGANRKTLADEASFTTVVYKFSDEQMPYLSRIPGNPITLRQFKDYMPKKGRYRYYFVTPCEDLEMQPIQEEITDDCEFLPLWKGKVNAQIRAID